MSEALILLSSTNDEQITYCGGKPKSLKDVQCYYFACRNCGGALKLQPQFMEPVSDGINVMCANCAENHGFHDLRHYNMSSDMKKALKCMEGSS